MTEPLPQLPAPGPPRYLIVNADDLGLSEGVNRGILEAAQQGIVSSSTVMVNMPAAEAGIRLIPRGSAPRRFGFAPQLELRASALKPGGGA